MLTELQVKPLIGEREISYSGEMILKKIANSIGLNRVLENYTRSRSEQARSEALAVLATFTRPTPPDEGENFPDAD